MHLLPHPSDFYSLLAAVPHNPVNPSVAAVCIRKGKFPTSLISREYLFVVNLHSYLVPNKKIRISLLYSREYSFSHFNSLSFWQSARLIHHILLPFDVDILFPPLSLLFSFIACVRLLDRESSIKLIISIWFVGVGVMPTQLLYIL